MKIAINAAFFQPKGGGIREYIDNLVNNIYELNKDHEIIVYVLQDQLSFAKEHFPAGVRLKTIPFNSKTLADRIKRSLFETAFWKKEEEKEKFDIFHSPFFHAPSLKKAKVLLTVHDLRLYRFPETYEYLRYQFLKRKVRSSIRKADHLITISEFTKKEIKELCGVGDDNITVILEAINRERFSHDKTKRPKNLDSQIREGKFILAVGHIEPRKNYDRLMDAFEIVRKNPDLSDLQLVIVGKQDHSFKETIERIHNTSGIHYLNFLDGSELNWLYANASLFVFPSYYEGFGFPPLEAASLGTISAVSNVSSIPEVCGDGAFYFDPYNIDEMASAIKEALTDKKKSDETLDRMMKRIDHFSWKRNAEETIKVYNSLGK